MLLTFEKIREISLNEKQEKLQELPENFFENAKEYLKSKKGTIEEASARNLVEGIFVRRQKKILELCFHLYKTNKTPENMEKDEEEFYLDLVSILKNFYDVFRKNILEQTETVIDDKNIEKQSVISEENKEETTTEKENQPENNEAKREQNMDNHPKTISEAKKGIDAESYTIINNEAKKERDPENNPTFSNEIGEEKTQIESNNEETGKPNIENQLRNNTETKQGTNIEKSREQIDLNKTQAKSDKTKVVFLKDVPEIISPDFEICCFKKGEEIELEQEFVEVLKEKGFLAEV